MRDIRDEGGQHIGCLLVISGCIGLLSLVLTLLLVFSLMAFYPMAEPKKDGKPTGVSTGVMILPGPTGPMLLPYLVEEEEPKP